jgi:hypothetical protein
MSRLRGLFAAIVATAVVVAAPAGGASTTEANWTLGGEPCKLIPLRPASPIGTGSCPGVRPGALVRTKAGDCTLNFLFRGSDGRRYIGTAGHCVLGEGPLDGDGGERKWAAGRGPVARDSRGRRIGRFAYAILRDPKDFALIRVRGGIATRPGMCHFGGPTGINRSRTGNPLLLHLYGNALAVGEVAPARTVFASGMPNRNQVWANGVAGPGDSGAGTISRDGRAVGVLVTVGLHPISVSPKGVHTGTLGITRLGPQIARAERAMGKNLRLKRAARR